MVVCKYFLQGRCKFGDFCNFEHQINDTYNSYQNGTSILRQPNFGSTQIQSNFGTLQPANAPVQASTAAPVDTATLVKSVVNDMTSAEKGGQWLLSCYAPFKEKPAFPGFEDQSFEELRLAYYEAMKNGSLEQYRQQFQMMIQQIQMKIKSLQNPSPDIVNLLNNIYNTPPSSQSGVFSGNLFNSPNTTSLNQQGTGFGQQATSIFAQANPNIFGGTQQQTTSHGAFGSTGSNIFGSTTQNSIFGGQSVSNSPFASQAPPQMANTNMFAKSNFSFANQGNSIFGVQQQPQQNLGSIFGGNTTTAVPTQSAFQQSPFGNQNVFGQPIQQNNSMFNASGLSQQPPTNIFGSQIAAQTPQLVQTPQAVVQNQQVPTHMIGASTTPSMSTGSIFGQQTGTTLGTNINSPFGFAKPDGQSSNIFGGNAASGGPVPYDESLYSKLEDLTPEEIAFFESDDWDIMNIPEKLPPYEICFPSLKNTG